MHALRGLIESRALVALTVAAIVGVAGLRAFPVDTDDPFLSAIAHQRPDVLTLMAYGYALLWFSTPFHLTSLTLSVSSIVLYRKQPRLRYQQLPPYPQPETRRTPFVVLGESHYPTRTGRATQPTWLTVPERGLYTGIMILGAVGTGKTSACMYPYVDQLIRWKSQDPERKIGGLVMEVKGDFCRQVQQMLANAGRADDYVEIGLETGRCYNPLHNDLDPYAVAYAIASLLNNLFGKSKEPFWQQAYTDLLKFVILLRRLSDGYTTLSDVYRYILDDTQIDRDIQRLKPLLAEPPEVVLVPKDAYHVLDLKRSWMHWYQEDDEHMAHPYDAELETFLDGKGAPYRVRKAQGGGWADRRHQLDAVERWFEGGWRRLDARLRSSITEGIVVFLSLFDDNPAVHRAFCPPRGAYAGTLSPGEPVPLPPVDTLLDNGRILALNFPIATNPGLARIIGVMLKLDFQRAVLNRIPRMSARPDAVWRDLLFVCDEYHAFATVGETDPTGDERTFALSRQARLIPIVATQSISSLRSVLPGDESWRTLLQCFRNKVFLATSDEFTARNAADLCGRQDRLKAHYSLSESGREAHISLLTGRAAANKHSITATKSYAPTHEHVFAPRMFTQLQNAQAIVLPYDGVNPLPPQLCYLKPHYLDVQTSYFDHLERGAL
ncbi:MAG: type IV secretion system DNA-binding domain-containing protein [Planctomycetota bacterium]